MLVKRLPAHCQRHTPASPHTHPCRRSIELLRAALTASTWPSRFLATVAASGGGVASGAGASLKAWTVELWYASSAGGVSRQQATQMPNIDPTTKAIAMEPMAIVRSKQSSSPWPFAASSSCSADVVGSSAEVGAGMVVLGSVLAAVVVVVDVLVVVDATVHGAHVVVVTVDVVVLVVVVVVVITVVVAVVVGVVMAVVVGVVLDVAVEVSVVVVAVLVNEVV